MNVELTSDYFQVKINSLGAELTSVTGRNNLEYIWQANPSVWARHAPVLFPIVGKLKDNEFTFESKTYHLTQHGFARDKNFELVSQSDTSCVFELVSGGNTLQSFPFNFTLLIAYYLQGNVLQTKYTVINRNDSSIFFSIGAHPAFRIPLLPNETFEDYYLEFEGSNYETTKLEFGLRTNEFNTLQIQNKRLPLNKQLFENDALVFENSQINKISLLSEKSVHGIVLESKNWPYFGIWSKKDCEQFVCLEPWYGIADKIDTQQIFPEKEGILELSPNNSFQCEFSLTFL